MGKKFDRKRKGSDDDELSYDPEVVSDRNSDVSIDSEEEALRK